MQIDLSIINYLLGAGVFFIILAFLFLILALSTKDEKIGHSRISNQLDELEVISMKDDESYLDEYVDDDELEKELATTKKEKKGLFSFLKRKNKANNNLEDDFEEYENVMEDEFYKPEDNNEEEEYKEGMSYKFNEDELYDNEKEEEERYNIEAELEKLKILKYKDDELNTPYNRLLDGDDKEEEEIISRIRKYEKRLEDK